MKNPDWFLERNIKSLMETGRITNAFGVSYVQHHCRIGYNQACQTIERAIEQKILERDADCEWRYRFATNTD